MLDHQAARRLRQGAHAACALIGAALACAAPASAQIDVPVLTPPVVAPPAPGADTTSLGGDAAHRNAWLGAGLRPPLQLAWQVEASPVMAPLAVGALVVVESASALTAYNAADGSAVWNVSLPQPAELATDGTRVFLATASGVTAISAADGSLVWDRPGVAATGPTAADGRVIVGTASGAVIAYAAATGAQSWSAPTGIAGGRPAVAGSRAYVTGHCSAAAIATTTGLPIWSKGSCATDTGVRTLLAGPFVLGEDAGLYAAEDGTTVAPGPSPGTIGAGVLFLSPIVTPFGELTAIDATTFKPRWTWTPPLPGRLLLRPAAVDDTIWQVVDTPADGLLLGAVDAASGAERWTGFLPAGGGAELAPGVATAVATSPGLLLVPTDGGGLAALRNAPAGPLGVKGSVPRNVYAAGSKTVITGTLTDNGHGLVGPRPVILEADRFPYGRRFRVVAFATAGRNGFSIPVTITRNTRFRFKAEGVTYAATPIYAEPTLSVVYARTSRSRVVRATLSVKAIRGLRRRGARVGIYRRRPRGRMLTRLGSGVTVPGGTAEFNVRIPASLKRTDRILTCMRGASRQGFGYPDVLDRHCGDRRISITAQAASSSARRSLRTGTGSAMPLMRFAPASEKR